MARWQDRFFVSQSVEIMIEGKWVRGTITRKTLRGTPIVRTDEGTFAADRKDEVRRAQLPELTEEEERAILDHYVRSHD